MAHRRTPAAPRGLAFTRADNRTSVPIIRSAEFFDEGFPFHLMRLLMRREDWRTPIPRRRDFWKLVCLLDGEGRHVADGKSIPIRGGDFLLVGPHEATAFLVDSEELRIVNILFQPSWLAAGVFGLAAAFPELFAPGKGQARRGHFAGTPAELTRLVKEMELERLRGGTGSQAILRLKLAELLLKLSRCRPKARRVDLREKALGLVDERLVSAFDEAFSLKALAREAGMHPNSLARLYRKARGRSLSDAWECRRVEKACEFLAHGEMSVTRIAGEVGFNDLSFFYRIFKRYRGMAPGDWRQKQRGLG